LASFSFMPRLLSFAISSRPSDSLLISPSASGCTRGAPCAEAAAMFASSTNGSPAASARALAAR
jgi:hypothetical protein